MSDRCAQQMADLIESGISERDALYQEIDALKAHAVEVLFKYISRHHEMTEEKEKAMRTEARRLLGWEE